MPDELDRVMFMCSGSEANDLAVRCAGLFTGIAWLRQINDFTPLTVANPLPAADGSYIQVVELDGTSYFCVATEFLSGVTLEHDNSPEAVADLGHATFGDGKIFVKEVYEAVRVRTNDRGNEAL